MVSLDTKIGSISTFLQLLELGDKVAGKQLYFRGHSKSSYALEPKVYRNRGWIDGEATMLKELILRCPNDFVGGVSTFQALVRMQHYGLPTRLLDLTSNPLVALYFACDRHADDDEDAQVIVFGFDTNRVKYFDSDTVSVIANLSRRPSDFVVPDIADRKKFNDHDAIRLLLHDVRQDRPHFEPEIRRDHLGSVICVRPRLENPRIIRQEGSFLLFGCDGHKQKPATLPEDSILMRLVIKRERKKVLVEQLARLGINNATMFPEIDQVATYISDVTSIPTVKVAQLKATQRTVFEALRLGGARTAKELVPLTALNASTVSRAISKLNDARVVEAVGARQDRRWRVALKLDVVDGPKDLSSGVSPVASAKGVV